MQRPCRAWGSVGVIRGARQRVGASWHVSCFGSGMPDLSAAREHMVRAHVAGRGIRDAALLAAMRQVPREAFLPPELAEFAYEDTPLPIARGQTISQPYIVALMTAALALRPQDRVLEIGTGSGYAAAVVSRIAREVYTIERHAELAEAAGARLRDLGFRNVHVLHGDGTLGWPAHAPYDAIVVTAGGPAIPEALLAQLAVGGRLVIPVGEDRTLQTLVRVTRAADGTLRREDLGDVRFVPLIGAEGWEEEPWTSRPRRPSPPATVARLLRDVAEPIAGETADLDFGALLERIGDARIVCLGEATHGTAEFYTLRAEITKALVRTRGFTIVAAEADWPDAARIHRYVRGLPGAPVPEWRAFMRFPQWMWRNHEVLAFVEWLRDWNAAHAPVGFYGLDLYSLYRSIHLVLDYLARVDPAAGRAARERYGGLMPWEGDPATYGRAVVTGRYRACEPEVVAILRDLLAREVEYAARDGEHFLDAVGNARVVANAEAYYRVMYYGGSASWNLRDGHMFDTLQALLRFHGPGAKAVLWEHNSHLGDAAATEMAVRGELNVGHLSRQAFGDRAYLIGFGTDHGTVAAAHDWDGPMHVMSVRPSHPESYEHLCHETGIPSFLLPLRTPARPEVRDELAPPRLERAIGVVYRPQTELQSHYFHAALPHQFDEWVWLDETRAVRPVTDAEARGVPRAHPFAPYGPP
jgi:protein-L-isoaspartate(D-aspartate) O-methyltransferase